MSPITTSSASGRSIASSSRVSSSRCAHHLPPDLILLDIYLPDMTGLQVLEWLRAGGEAVGVIMIAAVRELDTVSGAINGSAADCLIKPFEFD